MQLAFYKAWIFEWNPGRVIDYLIALWDLGRFSHVELVFPSRGKMFSSSPRSKTGDGKPLVQGSRFIDIPEDLVSSGKWVIVDLPDITPEIEEVIFGWCEEEAKNNKGYDFAGVLSFLQILRWLLSFIGVKLMQSIAKLFCSETCEDKLVRAIVCYKQLLSFSLRFEGYTPCEVTPNGLYQIAIGRKPRQIPWLMICRAIIRSLGI